MRLAHYHVRKNIDDNSIGDTVGKVIEQIPEPYSALYIIPHTMRPFGLGFGSGRLDVFAVDIVARYEE